MSPAHHSVAALAALLLLASPARAAADPKQVCADAYDETQTLRDKGRLLEARKRAIVCSAAPCSTHVIKDCARWLAEIDANLATIVLAAEDTTGAETTAVRVSIDHEVVAEKLDGKALQVDPGEHSIRWELSPTEVMERRVVVRQGEKNRILRVSFYKPPPVPPPPPPDVKVTTPPPVIAPQREGAPAWAFITGAGGLVLLGIGAGFGAAALHAQGELTDVCGGDVARCPVSADKDSVPLAHRRDLDRNVFIGLTVTGAAALGAGVVGLILATRKPAAPRASFVVLPFVTASGGGVAAHLQR